MGASEGSCEVPVSLRVREESDCVFFLFNLRVQGGTREPEPDLHTLVTERVRRDSGDVGVRDPGTSRLSFGGVCASHHLWYRGRIVHYLVTYPAINRRGEGRLRLPKSTKFPRKSTPPPPHSS